MNNVPTNATNSGNPTAAAAAFRLPELLSPAGDWECARAAVENGADAIYFGLERFNARMRAHNFSEADLPKLMAFLHRRGVKGYVTFNTLVFQNELPDAEQYVRSIIAAGVDAAIVQDVGICRLIRNLSPDFPIHGSTQMTVTSAAGVAFARELGCHLVVLARENSLKEIGKIQDEQRGQTGSDQDSVNSNQSPGGSVAETDHWPLNTGRPPLPIEVFVHGALCVAYSGQCLTSEALGGRSANRGECAQACRMPYDLIADGKLVPLGDRKYLLSPQDLAGLEVLPDLVRAGVASLKIEGRLKTPEYVANITRVYRQALDKLVEGRGSRVESQTDKLVEGRESRVESQTDELAEGRESRVESQTDKLAEGRGSRVESQTDKLVEGRESRVESQTDELAEGRGSRVESQTDKLVEGRESRVESQTDELAEGRASSVESQTDKLVEGRASSVESQTDKLVEGRASSVESQTAALGSGPRPSTLDPRLSSGPRPSTLDPRLSSGPRPSTLDPRLSSGPRPSTLDSRLSSGPRPSTLDSRLSSGPRPSTLDSRLSSGPRPSTLDSRLSSGPRPSTLDPRLSSAPRNDRYDLEMAFSRGLYTGWFAGVNNQALVHARFGKKRGVFLGEVTRVEADKVFLKLIAPLKAGDGVVFDAGHPDQEEQGGRVYEVATPRGNHEGETTLAFGRGDIDFARVHIRDKVWKTSDPELDRRLRRSYEGESPKFQRPLDLEVHGRAGQPMTLVAWDEAGHVARVESAVPLTKAEKQPLTTERLREQLGRLGGTPFQIGELKNHLAGEVILPVSDLNRMRRQIVEHLEILRAKPMRWAMNEFRVSGFGFRVEAACLRNAEPGTRNPEPGPRPAAPGPRPPELIVLVRDLPQLEAALRGGVDTLYCEFEDPKKYREAVRRARDSFGDAGPRKTIWVAPPRIFKPGEEWILKLVRASEADGYLVRNYDHLKFFGDCRRVGDFPLNVANALTADYFKNRFGLERLTASYDLNAAQLEALLQAAPPEWFEVTIHQHMPMFHMEHCVFCAFLSQGTDYSNCGRPCDRHEVKLRDRVGAEHVLKADVGCRNTVFNARAQTGAEHVGRMLTLGLRHFRIEFVNETPGEVAETLARYGLLLRGEITGAQLWRELKLHSQLGVTRGAMEKRS